MSLVLVRCHIEKEVWWSPHCLLHGLGVVVRCTLQGMVEHSVAEGLLPGTWCVGAAGVGDYTCICSQHTHTHYLVTIPLWMCSS